MAHHGALLAFIDGAVQLRVAADGVDEVADVRHVAGAGGAGLALAHFFSLRVVDDPRITRRSHGAVVAVEHDFRQWLLRRTRVATALHPLAAGVTEIIDCRAGVRRFLRVVVEVAAAVVGRAQRIVALNAPTQDVERVDAVVAELAIAPVPDPVPVVMRQRLEVVFRIIRHGALPKIVVDVSRGGFFVHRHGFARVVVEAAAKSHRADGTAVQRFDGILHPGAALIAHLHEPVVFRGGGDDHFRLVRVLAAGFFDIDMLPGLHAEQRGGRVPEIRRGDEDGVQRLVIEEGAEVLHSLAGDALLVVDDLQPAFESLRVHFRQIRDLHIRQLQQRLHMRHAATQRDDGHFDLLPRRVGGTEFWQGGHGSERGRLMEESAAVHGGKPNRLR